DPDRIGLPDAICGNAAHAGGRNAAAISPRTSLQEAPGRGDSLCRRGPGAAGGVVRRGAGGRRQRQPGARLPPAGARAALAGGLHRHWLAARAGDDAGRRSPVAAWSAATGRWGSPFLATPASPGADLACGIHAATAALRSMLSRLPDAHNLYSRRAHAP